MTPLDLSVAGSVHVVGAGGAGMSAIASVLKAMGHQVTGSDLRHSPIVARLQAEGVPVAIGHDPANVGTAKIVAVSSAIGENNPEIRAACDRGIPVMRRSDILPAIAAKRSTIAVAGTHGKTTTSSMLALVLVEAGMNPSFIIGGDVNEVGTGAMWDDGDWFVVEADESDRTFLSLHPEVAVVTNIEPDHMETYGNDFSELEKAFAQFVASGRQAVVCADDEGAARFVGSEGVISYGTAPQADYRITDVTLAMPVTRFTLSHAGRRIGRVELPSPGLYNARNASAAIVAALTAGASFDDTARALKRFGGVARRFEFRGTASGVTFVDDYAHLPGEVAAVLDAARTGDWRRIICVFQPHRYSRTASVGTGFAHAFQAADQVVLTDIYPAGEAPRPGVTTKIVLDAVRGANQGADITWLRHLDETADWLEQRLRPGDLCLTLGAGDLTSLPDIVIERLEARAGRP